MDLIANLSSQLGIDAGQAQGLAGTALGFIQRQVADKVGSQEASALENAVPELGSWGEKAAALGGGTAASSGGGGLLGMAAGLVGGGELGELAGAASKLGLDASSVQKALPLITSFLESRLDAGTLSKILQAVPFLKGGGGGGLAGALGGLL